jgi:hypothetical protein
VGRPRVPVQRRERSRRSLLLVRWLLNQHECTDDDDDSNEVTFDPTVSAGTSTLTVSFAGSGSGWITGSDINCPTACSASNPQGNDRHAERYPGVWLVFAAGRAAAAGAAPAPQ